MSDNSGTGKKVGIFILVLSAVLTIAAIVVGYFTWSSRFAPTEFYRGSTTIGIRYEDGAEKPWRCLDRAIDAYVAELALTRFKGATYTEFTISVIGYADKIPAKTLKDGKAPATHQIGGKDQSTYVKARGSTDTEKMYPWSSTVFIVYARQLRAGDTWEEDDQGTGDGPLRHACSSALIHELAQHLLPWKAGEGSNPNHDKPELDEIEQAMQKRCTCPASS